MKSILQTVALAVLLAICSTHGGRAQSLQLDESNYATWRDHILPSGDDVKWMEIPWLSTFADGILAADREDKPVLLWTMNGHPLGCT